MEHFEQRCGLCYEQGWLVWSGEGKHHGKCPIQKPIQNGEAPGENPGETPGETQMGRLLSGGRWVEH